MLRTMEMCSVDECDKPVYVKTYQLCSTHYHRWRRHGDPLGWTKRRRSVCSVVDCVQRAAANGLCDLHYRRVKRYGSVDRPERPTICGLDGCGLPVQAKARCERHYRQLRAGAEGQRFCDHCGAVLSVGLHSRAKFCGNSCRQKELAVRRREGHRGRWLRQYGLTVETYGAMLASQGGGCAICATQVVPQRGSFCVDHDHETGRVRGVLCVECNSGLGNFKDKPVLLARAIAYLGEPEM